MDQSTPCKTNFTVSKIAFTMKNNLVIHNLLSFLWSKQETPKGNNKQIYICLYFLVIFNPKQGNQLNKSLFI